jgi:hypothetical protein
MAFVARVQVIPDPSSSGQIAASTPRDLSESDLDRIAAVLNQSVVALQIQMTQPATEPKAFGLSEVEIKFGIDLQGESKIPIIGPLLGIGVKAGATFQVTIKLTNSV